MSDLQQAVIENLREFSTPERPIYLVGGAVRDLLLNQPVHDLDFVMAGETRKLAYELACRLNGALYMLDETRETVRVILEGDHAQRMVVDFASLRGETLEVDLRGRDFTINAMAYDIAQPDHLIDPTGGLADLREKWIRACSPTSLTSDPLRVLRAVRLALAFQFRIDPQVVEGMRAAAPLLPRISGERLRDELFRMLDGPQASLAVRLMDQVGALAHVLPEMEDLKGVSQPSPHTLDAWEHTLRVVQYLEQFMPVLVGSYREELVADLTVGSAVQWLGRFRQAFNLHYREPLAGDRSPRSLLFLAALYHDIGKPATRVVTHDGRVRFLGHEVESARIVSQRGRALALSVVEIERVQAIVLNHMRVHQLTGVPVSQAHAGNEPKLSRRAIYRFFKDTGPAGVDVCLLSLADLRGTYGVTLPQQLWESELGTCRALLEAYWEKQEEVVSPPRILSGKELMGEFGLSPGKSIGLLLESISEAQAAGEIHDRAEALAFAHYWLQQHNGDEKSREGRKE